MAWDLADLRDAVASNLSSVTTLRVYTFLPGQLQPPAALILPGDPLVDRNQAMGRGMATVNLRVYVLVPSSNIEQAQRLLDGYVTTVPTALLSDQTLGDTGALTVGDIDSYDEFEVEGSTYMGFSCNVRIIVDDRPTP